LAEKANEEEESFSAEATTMKMPGLASIQPAANAKFAYPVPIPMPAHLFPQGFIPSPTSPVFPLINLTHFSPIHLLLPVAVDLYPN
jgi:hypothetical protein